MGGPRPRVRCPVCGRDVALTARSRRLGPHRDDTGKSRGYYCDGAGTVTEEEARAAELRVLAMLVYRYPDKAVELVAGLRSPMGRASLN